jgi:peptidoglycan/xylan/chitin deacetylase (PgdA/CDA1 family)
VDDGADADVVGGYARFARDSGIRMTFFVTGGFPGWTEHAAVLRPLVDSGQVQLGNHTWTHPWLTRIGSAAVARELNRNRMFLKNTFGVDATPFYRPPYGAHDETVDAVAADLGYRAVTMWYGSLSDSGLVTQDYIVKMAHLYFKPQALVIGHANHPPVTHVYPQLLDIIKARKLRTVTLNDVFLP